MWRYYRDITAYNLGLSALIFVYQLINAGAIKDALIYSSLVFAVFGTGLGILAFNYFQKQQYYLYHNLGFSKTYLVLKSWSVNFGIGIVVLLLTSIVF